MTDKRRKSFVLHNDSLDILDELTDEQVAKLFRAIKSFQNGEELEFDSITKLIFLPFKNQFVRDNEKYQKTCEARARAGSKGGKQKVANASNSKQKIANKANLADSDNESDSKSDSVSDSDNKNKRSSRFTPPTLEQVQAYCQERSNFIDPTDFINHYESNGWMRGKTKIKCWKACIRTWEKNQKPKQQSLHDLSGKNYVSGDL